MDENLPATRVRSTFIKFSLRDIFWMVLVAALALGWWTDRQAQSQKAQAREIELSQQAHAREMELVRQYDKWRGRAYLAAHELWKIDGPREAIESGWGQEDRRERFGGGGSQYSRGVTILDSRVAT